MSKKDQIPRAIAPAYVFLASNADSSYIATGTVLQVMGGETTGG